MSRLPGSSFGWALPAVDHLQAPPGDAAQPLQVGEEQVGALVGRGAAREAEGQHVRGEAPPGALLDDAEQAALGRLVRLPELLVGDGADAHEQLRLVRPARAGSG